MRNRKKTEHKLCLQPACASSIRHDEENIFERTLSGGRAAAVPNVTRICLNSVTKHIRPVELDYILLVGTDRKNITADDINCVPKETKNVSTTIIYFVYGASSSIRSQNSNLTNIRIYLISEKGHENCQQRLKRTVV